MPAAAITFSEAEALLPTGVSGTDSAASLLPSSMSLLLTRKFSHLILGYNQLDFGCVNKVSRNICRLFTNEACFET